MLTRLLTLLLPVVLLTQDPVRDRGVTIVPSAPASSLSSTVPRGYALVIGVGGYPNLSPGEQLRYSESDADAMYRVLISKEGGAFPSENVHLLKGRDATLANIRRELEEWLPAVAQPADRVVVYFAGHGFIKDGKGYLAPHDFDPALTETTGYAMAMLGEVMATKIKANSKVLLADACHSGKLTPETTNEGVEATLRNLDGAFLKITATQQRESSYEDKDLSTGFGLFTYFVVQAFLGQADNDPCDGRITADELIEYVRANVRLHARRNSVFQTPGSSGDYDPQMTLAVSRACLDKVTGGAAPAVSSLEGTAVVESDMEEVDVFLDGKLIGKVSPGKPLRLPGIASGLHTFEGSKTGYEPDNKQIMIVPGQEVTVTLRIRYRRQVQRAALELTADGEKLLLSNRSTLLNPLKRSTQTREDLTKAQSLFERALKEDPNYSKAAFYLGQVRQMLLDEKGSLEAYKKAIQIDPSYIDARMQYAAVLAESGDAEEGIRQLTEVLRLDKRNDEAYALLARAYWDKSIWQQAIDQATMAIELNPSNAQAYLWRADSLRRQAAVETSPENQRRLWERTHENYERFIKLTNIPDDVPCKIGFILGVCRRRHADRQSSFEALRSGGFLGMCISEQKLGNLLKAKGYCEKALDLSKEDPIAHFILGNVYRDLFNQTDRCTYLLSAESSYSQMLKLNSDIAEANNAKTYVERIRTVMPQVRSSNKEGC